MDPQSGAAQPDLIIGQTIGNYRVTQKLGEGGMGAVYLAEHPTIGKKVALKVLHSEFSSNPDVTERFFNEAKAVNDIGHPNIVDIVDYGIIQAGAGTQGPLVYFIMEYLAGTTLAQVIRNESPVAPERALAIALQVGDALSASHKCGIVHRDLKPDNIILIQRGREREFVKLLDFGIAKLNTDGGPGRTRTGMVLGTPAYMSPEQCEGRGNIDYRTDIYALGIVLYEMLTGRVPFIGEGYGDILIQHLTQRPLPVSQYRMMNLHVEAVVMKALEKNPAYRYPTMDEMMRAISDPVGYVEANGGVQGFAQKQLMPSTAPIPPARFTPLPGSIGNPPTPPPGSLTSTTPIPTPTSTQPVTPTPTTLGGASGEVTPRRSKTGFVVAGALVVVAAAAAVFVVVGSSKSSRSKEPVAMASGSDATTKLGSDTIAMTPIGSAGSGGSAAGSAGSGGSAGSATSNGPAGSAATSAGSGSAAGSASVAVTPSAATITLTTKPAGAKIYVNGAELAERTPAPFVLPFSKSPVRVVLRLDKHEDLALTLVPSTNIDQEHTLKPKRTTTSGKGPSSGGKGSGKGSAKANDTGLMRPDDL